MGEENSKISVTEAPVKKTKLWIKIVCIVLASIVAIVAVLGITFACVWSNEISTVRSFKQLRERNDDNLEGSEIGRAHV